DLGGLQDPAVMGKKRKAEAELREAVLRDPKLKDYASAWDEVESSLRYLREIRHEYNLLERGQAFRCDLFKYARTLVRAAEETGKPEGERLREYRSSGLDSLKFALFSEAPIHENLELTTLADSLSMLMEILGADNPVVQKVLAGKSPSE